MTIDRKTENGKLLLAVSGRLDTITAPSLEAELKNLDDVSSIELDFSSLEYISSAGLRTILSAHKAMKDKDGLVVKNVNSTIQEVFEITGFSTILTIE